MKFLSTLRFCSTLAIVALCANFAMAANRLYIEDFSIAPGEEKAVDVILENDVPVTSLQLYWILPEGFTFNRSSTTSSATERLSGDWNISANLHNGQVIVLFEDEYQVTPIEPGKGAICKIYITAPEGFSGRHESLLHDLEINDTDFEIYNPEDHTVIITGQTAGTPLATINASGEEGQEYTVADDLTIMATVQGGLLFATDGAGEWIKILSGDFADDVANMQAFAAGTTKATYNKINGNGQLTLTACPEAGNPADLALTTYDLSQPFAPKANEVINIIGYFYGDVLRGYAGLGQSASLNLAWCTNESSLMVGKQYKIDNAIVQLKEAWKDGDGAPRRINPEDYDYTFQNYEIYPTVLPDTPTAIEEVTVANDAAEQWIDLGGRLLNQQPQAAGIYIRIANGKAQKVVVK